MHDQLLLSAENLISRLVTGGGGILVRGRRRIFIAWKFKSWHLFPDPRPWTGKEKA